MNDYFCIYTDDMLIKLWDWEKKWSCSQVFEGHTHYVMQIVINPKDNNQFASASLDRTIKVRFLNHPQHVVFSSYWLSIAWHCIRFYRFGLFLDNI